jgi:hypothetical protein
MSGGLLFVSQALLDTWASQGRVDLDARGLALLSGEGQGRRYALEPAARFLRVVGGGEDGQRLLARVKTLAQIRELGGEALADSVVVGDVAYEVEPGYLAEAEALEAAGRAAPSTRQAGATRALPHDLEERRKEAEALARFLLDNLS